MRSLRKAAGAALVAAGTFGAVLLGVFYSPAVRAADIAVFTNGVVRVLLTNEPCRLDWIRMDYRATWRDPEGKVLEGCWTARDAAAGPVVLAIFDDRVPVLLDAASFTPVRRI